MLRGERVELRERLPADVPVLHAELYADVATRLRADSRPWRPLREADSPFAPREPRDGEAVFSVVELDSGELAGAALLWGIDQHNRLAHLGLTLRPACRGRGFGTDVVRVLCRYGFDLLGLHRLQVDTLADNLPMIRAAVAAGFTVEGTLRQSAWVDGHFLDEVLLGRLRPAATDPGTLQP